MALVGTKQSDGRYLPLHWRQRFRSPHFVSSVEKSAYEEFGHFRANERTRTRGLYYVYVRTEKQYIAGITHLLMLTSSVDGLKKMQHKDWTNILAAALDFSLLCSMFTQKHQMFELFASVLFYMLQNS